MQYPLEDIRVIDLSRVLAGPYCTMMLGDLGADVIKIERPGTGDDTRRWAPPYAPGGESAYFLCTNRNKRSITINLHEERGRDIVRDLVRKGDVLVENFMVGSMEKWGLSYENVRQLNPGLVYCSVTGYGQTGPYKDRPGYDAMIQAQGGIMSITGPVEGPPSKVGVAIADITTGLFACIAILSALRHRDATGRGQHIDMALLDSQVAWLANVASNYLISGERPKRYGNAHPNITPYETFPTADGEIMLAIGNDRQWQDFCHLARRPDLVDDPRFAHTDARVAHREKLRPIMIGIMRTRTTEAWLQGLLEVRIPAAPINDVDQTLNDPHVLARSMVQEINHPTAGRVKLVGPPIKMSATPPRIRRHPPLLGEHTDEVLRDVLGYSDATIARLHEDGII